MIFGGQLPSVSMTFTTAIQERLTARWEKVDLSGGETLVIFVDETEEVITMIEADEIIALAEAIKAARREDERLRIIRDGKT